MRNCVDLSCQYISISVCWAGRWCAWSMLSACQTDTWFSCFTRVVKFSGVTFKTVTSKILCIGVADKLLCKKFHLYKLQAELEITVSAFPLKGSKRISRFVLNCSRDEKVILDTILPEVVFRLRSWVMLVCVVVARWRWRETARSDVRWETGIQSGRRSHWTHWVHALTSAFHQSMLHLCGLQPYIYIYIYIYIYAYVCHSRGCLWKRNQNYRICLLTRF